MLVAIAACVLCIAIGVAAYVRFDDRRGALAELAEMSGLLLATVAAMLLIILPLVRVSERQRERACARVMAAALTHADSFVVAVRCEIPVERGR